MHEHVNCQHTFKYCSKCDVVFCKSCEREWEKKPTYTYTSTGYNLPNTLLAPYSTSTGIYCGDIQNSTTISNTATEKGVSGSTNTSPHLTH